MLDFRDVILMKEQFIEVGAIEKFFESLARFSQRLEPIVANNPKDETPPRIRVGSVFRDVLDTLLR